MSLKRRSPARSRAAWLIATASALVARDALRADPVNYTGGNSNWSNPAAWDTGNVPNNGDQVFVVNSATAPATLTFDDSIPNAFIDTLSVDSTGGPMTLAHVANTLYANNVTVGSAGPAAYQLSGDSSVLYIFGTETLGDAGTGTFSQNAGFHGAAYLTLGNASTGRGAFFLNGANSSLSVYGTEIIGGSGSGAFTQTAGFHYAGALTVGSSGSGTFTLGGTGNLTVNGGETIGDSGVGTFTQSAGAHTVGNLTLGSYGSGTFTLSGSTSALTVYNAEIVGDNGVGRFTQSAGSHTATSLSIGNGYSGSGTFTLSGGAANFGDVAVGGSVYGYQAGVGTLNVGGTGAFTVANTLSIYGSGTVNLSGGALNVNTLNLQGGGTLNWTGGALNLTGTNGVTFDNGTTFKVTTGQTLNVSGPVTVGSNGAATFNQSGGQHNAPAVVLGSTGGSFGQYALSNTATLTVANTLTVGDAGQGIFNQTGGTLNVGNGTKAIYLGKQAGSSGTYNLNGSGSALNANDLYVGYSGAGVFNQYNGNHTLGDFLSLGGQPDGTGASASGAYNLVNGQLTLNTLYTGLAGTGVFTQAGGNINMGASTAGYFPGSVGTVNFNGGSLFNYGDEIYGQNGTGTLNQTAGSHTSASLTLANGTSGVGVANITGGTVFIDGPSVVANNGVGTVNQSGGSHTALDLYVGLQAGSVGTYNLSNGATLHVSLQTFSGINYDGGEYLGYYSSSTFNQTGGVHTVDTYFAMGRSFGSSSVYNMSGGTFSAPAESVGYQNANNNVFTQTGGANSASGYLTVGDQTGTTGVYNLSGPNATLNVAVLFNSWAGLGTFNQSAGTNTVGSLFVAHEGTAVSAYNLSGGTLKVSSSEDIGYLGKGTFTQTGGTHSVTGTAVVTIASLGGSTGAYNLAGGTFTAGPVVNNGAMNFSGGTASFTNLGGVGNTVMTGTNAARTALTVKSFAQNLVSISGNALMTVTPAAAHVTNTASQLTIAAGGTLDLGNANLVTSTSPATIRSYLVTGYKNGAWNGTGLASTTAAQAASTSAPRAYGYATSADGVFGNAAIPAGKTLVKFTTPGDANLSGSTTFTDFLTLQNNYNKAGVWSQGDFDYSGTVDFNDFLILQNNFGRTLNASGFATTAAATLTSTPKVTYVLSPNDDGHGNPSPGHFAVYAVDSTGDGNRGLASYAVRLTGAASLTNLAPKGSYVTADNLVNAGFTLLRSADGTSDALQGSQETLSSGDATMVYGVGQTGGDLGSDGLSLTQTVYDARVLLATGTFDDLSALGFSADPAANQANVFLPDGTETIAATTALAIVPEPTGVALVGACVALVVGCGRRRRVRVAV